jgi:two-component system, LuxR family, response regulator FixJ
MLVYIVDDDEYARQSLSFLLNNANIETREFATPSECLDNWEKTEPGCLVVDFQLPEMSGLELIREVRERGSMVPFVLATGHGTKPLMIQALRLGAVNVIEKPFLPDELIEVLESIRKTILHSQALRQADVEVSDLSQRLDGLTAREFEVLDMVVNGHLTKQIAKQLGISQKTVEVHRSNITKKLGVQSVAQLVKLVVSAQLRLRVS